MSVGVPTLRTGVLEDALAFVGTYVFPYSRWRTLDSPQLWRVIDADVPEGQPFKPVCRVLCVDHTGQRVWFWGNTMCYDQSRQAEFALQFAVLEAEAQGAA